VAVITKFIVVRDGVELDRVFADKKEAEAYDKMLDAAQDLALLLKQGNLQTGVDDKSIYEISVYLAKNAPAVAQILKSVKPFKPAPKAPEQGKPVEEEPAGEKRKSREPKSKAKSRAN
jgi:dsDNA-binding SOS-regulon protein